VSQNGAVFGDRAFQEVIKKEVIQVSLHSAQLGSL